MDNTCNLKEIEKLVQSYFIKDSILLTSVHLSSTYFRIVKFKYIEKDDNERVAFVIYRKLRFLSTFLDSIGLSYDYSDGYVYVTVRGW